MKGIVLEIRNNDAAILTDDGVVRKIKNHNYKIGEVIIMKEKRKNNSKLIRLGIGIAAAIAFSTTGAFAYSKPTGYVSLDINPSIEYSINMFERVLEVKAVNEDGKEILADLKLKNMSIDKAIEETAAKLIEENYISEDENGNLIITASTADIEKAERLAEQLKEKIKAYIEEEGKKAQIEAIAVGRERVEQARALGVTPGKLNLVEKLIESSDNPDEIDIEEWLDKSAKEINKTIKENREALKNSDPENELEDNEFVEDEEELAETDEDVKADENAEADEGMETDEEAETDEDVETNEAQGIGLERVKQARALGVTPGKLNLVEKLIESSDNPDKIDTEEWLDKSAKEINKTIKENREALKNSDPDEETKEETEIDEESKTGEETETDEKTESEETVKTDEKVQKQNDLTVKEKEEKNEQNNTKETKNKEAQNQSKKSKK